jgi:hypothetical protein
VRWFLRSLVGSLKLRGGQTVGSLIGEHHAGV